MIAFERSAYDALVERAKEGIPEEVCGVLAGSFGPERSTVESIRPTANAADRPRVRYAIDPEELFATVERVEGEGREVVGFYHSHPTGPSQPSETDVSRATWDGYSYVICALDGAPFVGSWRWNGDAERFEREVVALR